MPQKNTYKVSLFFLSYAILILLLHFGLNSLYPHLNVAKELIPIHVLVFGIYFLVFAITKKLARRYESYKPLIILGGISAKMLLIISCILIFYLTKQQNKDSFTFALFGVYFVYIPLISYFYITDFN